MTVAEVYARLLAAGWNVLRESADVRTLSKPGTDHLLTLAGSDRARIPETTLGDIEWTAGIL